MENNTSALHFLFRNRKLFLSALLTGGILGVGITFFIPKKYLSTAIVYPYSAHTKADLMSNPQFGYELETEQLMQLMESKSMRDRTIEHFKLYKYYGMDTNEAGWRSELTLRYIKDITFFRSKYLSVIINVETRSPELSAKIANFQVSEVNNYRAKIFQQNREDDLASVKQQLDKTTKLVDSMKTRIYAIKSNKSQLVYNFMENLNNENYDASVFVNDPLLEEIIPTFIRTYNAREFLAEEYKNKKAQLETPLPSVYVVDSAYPSYRKNSPSMMINGFVGAFTVFFATLTWVIVRRKWLELKSTVND